MKEGRDKGRIAYSVEGEMGVQLLHERWREKDKAQGLHGGCRVVMRVDKVRQDCEYLARKPYTNEATF